ncbi:hypothetical protein CKO12_05655 [Chromatium okenii]|uniref:Hpt domain-containing protein n=1 Tax=Chromatium okenii TaxID=61644 RepID=UPI001905AF67|nr:Hpt domain-containing protein [Chromatium okenii]MBK1641367.1 hypothetical protein [Chromatium okenii]
MAEKQVVEGLKWVKGEIAATLRPVRDLVEHGSGSAVTPSVLQALDQVQGVLLALQLPSAARLVLELRSLLAASPAELPLEVLQQALTQLTTHLDRLDAGAAEPPLRLAVIINALRTARSEAPLPTAELLNITLQAHELAAEPLARLVTAVRKVRPHYHRHLVEWLRGDPEHRVLTTLGELFGQVAAVPDAGVVGDLFQLAQLFTQAVRQTQRVIDAPLRSLLGHLDRVLKPLAQTPPQVAGLDALALIEQFLNLLNGMDVSGAQLAPFNFRYGAPATTAAAGVEEITAEVLLTALSHFSALKQEFNQIATAPDPAALAAMAGQLRELADTLEGAAVAPRLRECATQVEQLPVTGAESARWETVAMELLEIEAALHPRSERQVATPALDLSELTAATLREAGYELLRVKEAMLNCHDDAGAGAELATVKPHLLNVAGALMILGELAAAQLADALAEVVERLYVQRGQAPDGNEFEQLADALAALELFIGHLQDAVPFGDSLIGRGSAALRTLLVKLPLAEPADEVAPAPVDAAESELAFAWELEAAPVDIAPAEIPAPAVALELDDVPTLPVASAAAEAGDGVDDPEFLEIFMEEAQEETTSAQLQCARWVADPTDTAAQASLRRSFHTLKGSGRLVGALQIADFAQAFELLLNRLTEERIPPAPAILEAVAEAVALLPTLLTAQLERRECEIQPLVERATWLRENAVVSEDIGSEEVVSDLATDAAAALPSAVADDAPLLTDPAADNCVSDSLPAPLELADQVTDHDSLFLADEELLRIFQTETHDHLAELTDFLQKAATGTAQPDQTTQRALHTLTGSARMAGIDSIAVVSKGLELCLKPVLAASGSVDAALLALLARAVEAIALRVDELPALGTGAALLVELGAELERRLAEEVVEEVSSCQLPVVSDSATDAAAALPSAVVDDAPPPNDHTIDNWQLPTDNSPAPDNFFMPAPDPEMAGIFLEDARDLLDHLDTQFRAWQLAPQDISALDGINRLLHTLKGSARLTGLAAIGDLSHALETRLKAATEDHAIIDDTTLELAQRAVDALSVQVDALEQHQPIPCLTQLVAALSGLEVAPLTAPAPSAAASPVTVTPQAVQHALETAASAVPASTQIRVRSDLLNQLVNAAGEISIYRGRLTQRNGLFNFSLGELDQTVFRLSEQLRQLDIETQTQIMHRFERQGDGELSGYDSAFDPLELDRFSKIQQLSGSLVETVNDLVSIRDMLAGYQREFTDLLTQQARLADDLQDGLLRTRLVPFVQVVPRLQRLVRQTADSLGKSAQLEVIGPEVELDRTVLDRLVAPLEHLLRNAVDHGLEDPEARLESGKSATGRVTLALHREGNDAVISLSDDGKGMNLQAIRRKAISLGLLAADTVLPDDALLQFILEPGFTTSEKVTQISGRGVGLDVVASEIKAANGSITLGSVAGQGARFTIRLPLTLAIIEAFLVSAGDNIYAIPHGTVEAATRISREELLAIYRGENDRFTVREQHYRVVYLGGVLDPEQQPDIGDRRWLPVLLIRLGEQRVALHVDTLIESQRILVKPLGPQLARVRWLSGGTILSDGRVALILDALALLRSGAVATYRPNATLAAPTKPQICVMVVDDSLTVRRVTSRLLRRQNMEVLTAKDGVEALTLLDENRPDLLLLDVEMPRMDGYELARHIRRSEALVNLPIIMITSRTSAKHREYATALGVNRYLGKPYQELELLNEIHSLLEEQSAPTQPV